MASLTNILSTLRQPGSTLQPKPGVMQAGGNAPQPVLSQPEQQAPSTSTMPQITPKAPSSTPTAQPQDPVVPGYQQALMQQPQQLAPIQAPNTPQYSGYTPDSSSAGNAAIVSRIPQGGADRWTPEQWAQAYAEVQGGNPFIANTVSADGIKSLYDQYISKGLTPDQATIGRTLGGAWLSDYKPSTVGSVTLQPGEQQGPNGVSRAGLNVGNDAQSTQRSAQPNFADMLSGVGEQKAAGGKPSAQPQLGGFTPGNANISVPEKLPPSVAQSGGDDSLKKIFDFLKGDLTRERDSALSEADADSARRGVFYGTPGAQSRDDIREKFGRSLGQFEANFLQNEQQNEFGRQDRGLSLLDLMQRGELGRSSLMAGLIPQDMESGGLDPAMFEAIAGMFGNKNSAGGVTASAQPVPTVRPVSVQTPMKSASLTPKSQLDKFRR